MATLLLLLSLLSACGGAPAADNATLPTQVPIYTPIAPPTTTAADPDPTATTAPTQTPTEAPTQTPTEASTVTPTPSDTPTTAPTATPSATAAPPFTPTASISVTQPATEPSMAAPGSTATGTLTNVMTGTVTGAATITATAAMTTSDQADLLPAELAAALAAGDPPRGQELTVSNGCIACHALGEGQVLVGPSWYSVGARAATRVAGESAEAYLYRSIVAPNDYLVEGFIAGLMPQVYGDTIPTTDLADIISYLLSLQ